MRSVKSGAIVFLFALAVLCTGSVMARAQTFNFQVCNQSAVSASVAIAALTAPGASQWQVEGWWVVPAGNCQTLGTFPDGWFYFYAEETGASGNQWAGTDVQLCVQYPGPFSRVDPANYSCQTNEVLRGFTGEQIPSNEGSFTWNLNPS
jgi:uncharacterized membrane protein